MQIEEVEGKILGRVLSLMGVVFEHKLEGRGGVNYTTVSLSRLEPL